MSDINLDFTVSNNSIQFTVEPNEITFTPTDVNLNIFGGGIGLPGGSSGQIQYNAGDVLGGTSNLTYDNSNGTTTISKVIVSNSANLGAVGNITITGGTSNSVLTTNGSGVLTWGSTVANAAYANIAGVAYSVAGANVTGTVALANYAAYAGNVVNAAQPNITSLGTLDVTTLKISGGTNGYVLETDGAGNLTWTAQTGGGGNGAPGGSNTQIQFNDAGSFGGNSGFTFNKTTGAVALPNNLAVTATVTAGAVTAPIVSLAYGTENVSLITAQTGTYNFDLISNSIRYTTSNASANLTLNFRGNSSVSANTVLANGQSITGTYVMSIGSTPYGVTAVQVDGSSQTIKWPSGIVPAQFANCLNSYTFTIIKTSTTPTYTVLGSSTRYA